MKHEDLILELAAWGFDEQPARPVALTHRSHTSSMEVPPLCRGWDSRTALLEDIPVAVHHALSSIANRDDLQQEFCDLEWRLGVVDLRLLVAFQRRLVLRDLDLEYGDITDWERRITLAFPPGRSSSFNRKFDRNSLTISSENPDLTVRLNELSDGAESIDLRIHHGSPFMEVGCYRGRWFLRDGYHRAYHLLRAGVFEMPAVIVQARTLEELGANRSWFFPEEILFGARPPLITDFLCADLVARWRRPAQRKIVRITITEEFEPSRSEEGEGAEYEHCYQTR